MGKTACKTLEKKSHMKEPWEHFPDPEPAPVPSIDIINYDTLDLNKYHGDIDLIDD